MERGANRILTTHVGSLVRPADLLDLLDRRRRGEYVDEKVFAECEARAVKNLVRREAEVGLDIVNDGEFGKTINWARYVLERLGGFEHRVVEGGSSLVPKAVLGQERRQFSDFYTQYEKGRYTNEVLGWTVTGPITYTGHAQIQRDIAALKKAVEGQNIQDVFMTAVSPVSCAPDRTDLHYKNNIDYLFALADALHEEYKAIVDAGFILQIDDAYLAMGFDSLEPFGDVKKYQEWVEIRVEAINQALRGLPPERTRIHVCCGSWHGPHVTDVEMKNLVPQLLKVKTGGYCIEMANVRHEHEWRIWETVKLPEGKTLIPGVITHSTNYVEHPELVAERIVRLAKLVGRENVIASTDCGFCQEPFNPRIHESIVWAKFESLVQGAELASRQLWG